MRGRAWRVAAWVGVPLVAVPAATAVWLAASGQSLPLPRAVLDIAQQQADFALRRAGTVGARVHVGDVALSLDRGFRPRLDISDIRLSDRGGQPVMLLPAARVTFHWPTPLSPVPSPRAITLDGLRLNVERRADGSFNLGFGVAAGGSPIQSYAQAMEELRRVLSLPRVEDMRLVRAEDVRVTIDDARAGRTWALSDGVLDLRRANGLVETLLTARVVGTSTGRIGFALDIDPEQQTTTLKARVEGIAARDISAQAAPLAVLDVLDAEVAGTLAASVDKEGALSDFEAELDLGRGALAPREGMEPVPFDAAGMALTYDPKARKIALTHLNVEGPTLRVSAEGHAYLRDLRNGLPNTIVTQLRVQDVAVDPEGAFTEPVRFSSGNLDARLRLDPFTVEVGQIALVEGDRILRGHGSLRAGEDGWHLAFDPRLNRIRRDQLLALWPLRLVPRTREWLEENVLEGDLRNVRAAIRIAPGQAPRVSLNYGFRGGDVRFLRTLPPIEDGEGYASIHDDRYAMYLHTGHVAPPEGGPVTADGSTLVVPDLRQHPVSVRIGLETESSVTAALSLLDQEPFRFLSRAGRDPDIGTGQAKVTALLDVPLTRPVQRDAIGFDVQGIITDFASDTLIKGRQLTAPSLRLTADPEALAISGSGHLGPVPFDATYRLPLDGGLATVRGTAPLSQTALTEFRIDLPDDLVSGVAEGEFTVELPKEQPPELRLTSDLVGVAAGVPAIGWSKLASAAGLLEVEATLSDPPRVNRLAVQGGGLEAEGRVALTPGGKLDRVAFSRVQLNGWLDAPVTLVGRQGATPAVQVEGGIVDLRRLDMGPRGAGGGDENTPVDVRLDTLQVTDGLALTDLRGSFATAGGFQGRFEGQVKGGAPLAGSVAPAPHGTAVHLTSPDAGGVLRSAGIFDKVRGGTLDLRLTPRAADGEYDGQASVGPFVVTDLPAAAGAVNALSGIGAAEQLASGGIVFNRADAVFRLTSGAIEVTEGAATGPSLGVSAAGVYRMTDKRFFMQGVVTPLYFLNGGGRADGEGLFGITWRLRGTAAAPDIQINPLSILAPGALRGLVQGEAPRLAE